MALDPTKKIIASGSWVRVDYLNSSGVWKKLGLVTKASYNEGFHVQGAKVLGNLGPIAYDSQDYSCEISIGAFVPEKVNDANRTGAAEGNALNDLLTTRSEVARLGKGQTFKGLRFVNTGPSADSGDTNIAVFSYVIVDSASMDIQPGSYVQNNIKMFAVERQANS